MIGVYAIRNVVAGKVYIGSSGNIKKRLICQKSYLKNGNHPATIRSLRGTKQDISQFSFDVVCETENIDQARELEDFLLAEIPQDQLYNLALDYTGGKVKRINLERYRDGAAKRLSDPEFRNKLSQSCKGKRQIVTCPKCGVSGGGGNMRRYHFDRCRNESKP
jgi:group I intron endonuclease